MQSHVTSNPTSRILGLSLAVAWIVAPTVFAADLPTDSTYQDEIRPFLAKNCFACHANGKDKGSISFEKYSDDQSVWKDRATWQTVQEKLHAHEMPPEDAPQPTAA